MANRSLSVWFYTNLPEDIVKILERDLVDNFEGSMSNSMVHGDTLKTELRQSQNTWIPTNHWIGGFLWHYVQRANRENFLYDLTCIDAENIQYTKYDEGEFYGWHTDSGFKTQYHPAGIGGKTEQDFITENLEMVRKLSFVMQLSDPDDYEGGNLQLLDDDGTSYIAPRQRGSVIMFDSRTQHRVQKVRKGTRKSLVGWVLGPRWR